jgi:hypothetical protein
VQGVIDGVPVHVVEQGDGLDGAVCLLRRVAVHNHLLESRQLRQKVSNLKIIDFFLKMMNTFSLDHRYLRI